MKAGHFQVGDEVVVTERESHTGRVSKVARRYLTVTCGRRSWEFDKETRSHRGDHCGYVPRLLTIPEHELLTEWGALLSACRALPYAAPADAQVSLVRAAAAAVLAISAQKGGGK